MTNPVNFGSVMQNGYVVKDLEVAAMNWVAQLGVGPFFFMEHIEFSEAWYHGETSSIDMSVAIAYSGDMQIELVQQHDSQDSIYQSFFEEHGEGLQHIGVLVDDLDATLDQNDVRSKRVQWGTTKAGQRFAYLDTDFHSGSMIELIESDQSMRDAFAYMKETCSDWDGSKPLRGKST